MKPAKRDFYLRRQVQFAEHFKGAASQTALSVKDSTCFCALRRNDPG